MTKADGAAQAQRVPKRANPRAKEMQGHDRRGKQARQGMEKRFDDSFTVMILQRADKLPGLPRPISTLGLHRRRERVPGSQTTRPAAESRDTYLIKLGLITQGEIPKRRRRGAAESVGSEGSATVQSARRKWASKCGSGWQKLGRDASAAL